MVVEKVYLLEGMFNESQLKGKEYLLYLDVDRLIAPCYEAAGQKAKKERYGGWEKTPIAGHSIGHWLSAAANMYHVTGDKRLKEKLNYALAELAHVQSYDTDGYVSGFLEIALIRCLLVNSRWIILVLLARGYLGTPYTKSMLV